MIKENHIMIDSSVWIDYFRGKKNNLLDDVNLLLDENRVAICGMIELEILQGLKESERNRIQDLFNALHFVEATRENFVSAGVMLNQLRKKGITIPSSDCLIAAQCIENDLSLFTLDKDFDYLHQLKKY